MADREVKNIMVIGAEKLSSIMNWEDRNTCVLFGDGAGCAILSTLESPRYLEDRGSRKFKEPGFIDSLLFSEGSGHEYLMVPGGGSRNPIKKGEVNIEDVSL